VGVTWIRWPVQDVRVWNVDVGVGAGLELVDKFCCIGDMLGMDGNADAAVKT